jgi:predicted N-acetyltransferase YhbS
VFPDDPPWNAPDAMIESKLRIQPELLLVAELAGGSIVGALIAGFDGVRGWLYHLAVAPEHRRRGFATQLVRAAEQGLRDLGCAKVNLQVRATNQEVVAFYGSVGYQIEDRVNMGRRLDDLQVIRDTLLEISELLESHDASTNQLAIALLGDEQKMWDFLVSNVLWGGAGSMADQSLPKQPEARAKLEKLMIRLGRAQMRVGRVNPRTEMWVLAFETQQA